MILLGKTHSPHNGEKRLREGNVSIVELPSKGHLEHSVVNKVGLWVLEARRPHDGNLWGVSGREY